MLSRVEIPVPDLIPKAGDTAKSETLMVTVIDQMTKEAVDELQLLKTEIEKMIAALNADSANVKDYLTRYFALRADSLEFRNQIRERLLAIANPEEKSSE